MTSKKVGWKAYLSFLASLASFYFLRATKESAILNLGAELKDLRKNLEKFPIIKWINVNKGIMHNKNYIFLQKIRFELFVNFYRLNQNRSEFKYKFHIKIRSKDTSDVQEHSRRWQRF